jgi:DNA repair exonuclease SbcCD nuclease subunit
VREFKALLVSDTHQSNSLPHARPAEHGATDRLLDQEALWKRINRAAAKYNCDVAIHAGDLFDKPAVDPVTMASMCRSLSESTVPWYLLPGNHDGHTTRGERFAVEAFAYLQNEVGIHHFNEPLKAADWLTFWPIEFMPSEKFWIKHAEAAAMGRDRGGTNVLIGHQSVVGCTHVGWTCDDGLDADKVVEGFDHAIFGHFHDHQAFGTDDKGMYCGAPMHHRFDDEGRWGGFWIMTFREDGTVDKKFIRGRAPKFFQVDFEDRGQTENWSHGDYIRLIVKATHAEFQRLLPQVREWRDMMNAGCYRASFTHRPTYHHETRLKDHGDSATIKMDDAIRAYVKAGDVDTQGLDKKKLKALGIEAFNAVLTGHTS